MKDVRIIITDSTNSEIHTWDFDTPYLLKVLEKMGHDIGEDFIFNDDDICEAYVRTMADEIRDCSIRAQNARNIK